MIYVRNKVAWLVVVASVIAAALAYELPGSHDAQTAGTFTADNIIANTSIKDSGLTATKIVASDASKNLVSMTDVTCSAGSAITAIAGTGFTCGAAGGGLFAAAMSTKPTLANTSFTFAHQPTNATLTDGAQGITIFDPNQSSSVNVASAERAAPATTYTIKMLISVTGQPNTDASGAVGWAQTGGGGKSTVLNFSPNNASGFNLRIINNNSYTSTNAVVSQVNQWPTPYIWVELIDNGTTATIKISQTGDTDDYYTLTSITESGSFLGAGNYNIIVFQASGFSGEARCKLLSWAIN